MNHRAFRRVATLTPCLAQEVLVRTQRKRGIRVAIATHDAAIAVRCDFSSRFATGHGAEDTQP